MKAILSLWGFTKEIEVEKEAVIRGYIHYFPEEIEWRRNYRSWLQPLKFKLFDFGDGWASFRIDEDSFKDLLNIMTPIGLW